ncbi:hypothetical protein GCM10025881_30880 [Pseudolysinimonas kribbensis]|uniref:Uncharacterized protein n=1 Tax=Pseudolysinimonas kribbensis TaxID=433641 RepID=A0ABQ6KA78_9MICO|nr:hypothetical protein [Pseudolysinimonas kribbensis]GMA96264.1 hypothetical protein GCM10025881_30880 [Pseudolysinimonas kribbensis]
MLEFTIRQIFVGARPPLDDAPALIDFAQRTAAGTLGVILIDTFLMASLVVFLAAFRQLITQVRPDLDWVSALAYGAGIVWVAITLVGDGLEGERPWMPARSTRTRTSSARSRSGTRCCSARSDAC